MYAGLCTVRMDIKRTVNVRTDMGIGYCTDIYILETDIVRTEIRNTRECEKRNVRMYVQDKITIWKANKQ